MTAQLAIPGEPQKNWQNANGIAYLHNHWRLFSDLTAAVSEGAGLDESFVVKDYFAVAMLKEVTCRNPALVFKGGTCLSKCYGVINRFSEDVDLGIQEEHATEGMRRCIKQAILESAEALGLFIVNLNRTRSRREYNRYEIALPGIDGTSLNEQLIVETAVMTPADPAQKRPLQSLIGEYCEAQGYQDVMEEFDLGAFEVLANSLERTFCDKVFAVCDYYLAGPIPHRQSRHLYDLRKLLSVVALNEDLLSLLSVVRGQRLGGYRTPSAGPEVDVAEVLGEIARSEVYRTDYERVTAPLLYEQMSYEEASSAIREIADVLKRVSWQ
ncbi:nucleotidyl transferase AbiEii/AbiGii toxin family protein [Adlercreutzia sp. R25]|uniref:nucleotidyl transferase AbiEii/AbiGii toxin family protein n=1 Tax=Adlercreutzia shanghongiae TaxID=3111773 RepID=UPI002DC00622|nr:nucleotidyl transferase AbiEii/AbiGii toxin family protein [Adlercreutzia sp. R25]MEC4271751.1 nucleotidyl transferase AbiEii/AbiGii toxin family protein [Adlercreutzia sp. R25]